MGFMSFVDNFRVKVQTDMIDPRMRRMGEDIVTRAKALVAKDTGQTEEGIGFTYRQDTRTVQIHSDGPASFFLEFGTRFMVAQPFLRPAMSAGGRVWGANTEMQFGQINSSGRMPMPRANAAAIKANEHINAKANRGHGGKAKVVFHGNTARSLAGYKPAYEGRFGD